MPKVRTVLGDIEAAEVGITLPHEHVIAGWLGNEWDPSGPSREERIAEAVRQLVDVRERAGVTCVVDPTTSDLGRDLKALREVSERSEVHIVAATGLYRHTVAYPEYWRRATEDHLLWMMVDEIETGTLSKGIRCGIIKVATVGVDLTELEEKLLRAAGRAAVATGVPIVTHTEADAWGRGNPGLAQVRALVAAGQRADRVLIGHACGCSEVEPLTDVLNTGAWLGFDRVGAEAFQSDAVRASVFQKLVAMGHARRLFLSHDHQAVWLTPPPAVRVTVGSFLHLKDVFMPMLSTQGVSDVEFSEIMVENPRRFFAMTGS